MDINSYNNIKNSLRVLNLRLDEMTDKNNARYRQDWTDRMYAHFKDLRQNMKLALESPHLSADEKKI